MNRPCFTSGAVPIHRNARMFLGPKPFAVRLDYRMVRTFARPHDST